MIDKYMKITRDLAGRKEEILKAFGTTYFSERSEEAYNRVCRGIKLEDEDVYFYIDSGWNAVYTMSQEEFDRYQVHKKTKVVLPSYKIKYRNSKE